MAADTINCATGSCDATDYGKPPARHEDTLFFQKTMALSKDSRALESDDDEIGLIVKYDSMERKKAAANYKTSGAVADIPKLGLEAFTTKRGDIQKIKNTPHVKYVEEEQEMGLPGQEPQSEEGLSSLLNLGEESEPYGIGMVEADELSTGPNPVKICVVDTGYGLGHPDLPTSAHGVTGTSNILGEWNFDGNGHGTMVAGVIGAIGGNNKGVVGVNPDPSKFTFHIEKGLSDAGSGSMSNILACLERCGEAGAKIVLGLVGEGWSQAFFDTYKSLYDDGVLIITGAGNSGANAGKSYPAAYPHVMSVAAVNSAGTRAAFSQNDEQVEIAAPGKDVESTVTTNSGLGYSYTSWSGTQMASPHVAGVAALVWSHFPDCTNNQIRNVLVRSAQDKGTAGCDEDYGHGIVKAKAAFDLLAAEGCDAGGPSPATLSDGAVGGCQQGYYTDATPFECSERTFRLVLTTNNYGSDSSWDIKDSSDAIVASGSEYASHTTVVERRCLSNQTYTFTLHNSSGVGFYRVTYDGAAVTEGGQFTDSESVNFPAPMLAPEPAPSPATTPAPTPVPMPTPAPFECSEKTFKLELATDNYGSDSSWDIKDSSDAIVTSGSEYASATLVVEQRCLSDQTYKFTLHDSYGDGLCCSYGHGWYRVTYDGAVVKEGGQFGYKVSVSLFASSTPAPTLAPEPAPAPAPEPAPTPVPMPALEESYWTLPGCPKKKKSLQPKLRDVSTEAYARCCDGGLAGAASTCSSNPCSGELHYQGAFAHCADQGKRLCTMSEIEQNICCTTGCGYDDVYVWTSDANATSVLSLRGS